MNRVAPWSRRRPRWLTWRRCRSTCLLLATAGLTLLASVTTLFAGAQRCASCGACVGAVPIVAILAALLGRERRR